MRIRVQQLNEYKTKLFPVITYFKYQLIEEGNPMIANNFVNTIESSQELLNLFNTNGWNIRYNFRIGFKDGSEITLENSSLDSMMHVYVLKNESPNSREDTMAEYFKKEIYAISSINKVMPIIIGYTRIELGNKSNMKQFIELIDNYLTKSKRI